MIRAIVKLDPRSSNRSDTFPSEFPHPPGRSDIIVSNEGNMFEVINIVYAPTNLGHTNLILHVIDHGNNNQGGSGKSLICG